MTSTRPSRIKIVPCTQEELKKTKRAAFRNPRNNFLNSKKLNLRKKKKIGKKRFLKKGQMKEVYFRVKEERKLRK